jgi:predicted dehydrogenase
MKRKNIINCGIVGYGASFNMGRAHAQWINQTPGLKTVAVCDTDSKRTEVAKQEIPEIITYNCLDEMLKNPEIDLVVIVTPHNTHYPIAMECLSKGKNVILEKPMCIKIKEADEMINLAKKNRLMLSVFHNRRWDGDYLALKEIVEKGLIGEIFHIEMFCGGYGHPGYWWRSNKEISGGAFYDWGAHYLDWLLGIVKSRVIDVMGYFHNKLVWKDITNEDQVRAIIRFENEVVADVQISSIAKVGKPRWRILGTKGGITDIGGDKFKLYSEIKGISYEAEVKYKKSNWPAYYQNISEHLLKGKPLIVKPEEARTVIAIMELAEKSAKTGKPESMP